MTAQADALKIVVTDTELEQSILNIDAFHKDGQFDMTLYKRLLGLNSMTPEIFEQLQRKQLRKQKLQDMIVGSVTVSNLEADSFYTFHNTSMRVDYLKVDPADFSEIPVTEDLIQAHYNDNKTRYQSEPKRRVAFIRYSPNDFTDQVTITREQVSAYFEANPEEFTIPEQVEASHVLIQAADTGDETEMETAHQKAMAVYQRAVGGEDFAELAKETSQGPSKEDGGYLGKFDRESMIKPFADAAFSMQPGEISKPVKTRFGWHVIKMMNRFDARIKTLDEVAEEIESRLRQETLQQLAYDKAEDAFDAVIDGDSLAQVALMTGKEVQSTKAFDLNGNGLDLDVAAGFAQAAFDLQLKQISDIQQIDEDYFLIEITEIIEPVQLPLEAVTDQISQELERKLRRQVAEEQAKKLLEAVKSAGNLENRPRKMNWKFLRQIGLPAMNRSGKSDGPTRSTVMRLH